MSSVLNTHIAHRIAAAGLDAFTVVDLIRRTIAEDLDGGVDVTSVATVPEDQRSVLDLVARASGVTCGAWVAAAVFDLVSEGDAVADVHIDDGTHVQRGDVIVSVQGRTRDLLAGERTA